MEHSVQPRQAHFLNGPVQEVQEQSSLGGTGWGSPAWLPHLIPHWPGPWASVILNKQRRGPTGCGAANGQTPDTCQAAHLVFLAWMVFKNQGILQENQNSQLLRKDKLGPVLCRLNSGWSCP